MKMITMNFAVGTAGYVPPRMRAVVLSAKREVFSSSKNFGSTIIDAGEEDDVIFGED